MDEAEGHLRRALHAPGSGLAFDSEDDWPVKVDVVIETGDSGPISPIGMPPSATIRSRSGIAQVCSKSTTAAAQP